MLAELDAFQRRMDWFIGQRDLFLRARTIADLVLKRCKGPGGDWLQETQQYRRFKRLLDDAVQLEYLDEARVQRLESSGREVLNIL